MRMENTEKQLARLEISRAKSLQHRPGLLIQKVVCTPQNTPSLKYPPLWTESGEKCSEVVFLRTEGTSEKASRAVMAGSGDRISSCAGQRTAKMCNKLN